MVFRMEVAFTCMVLQRSPWRIARYPKIRLLAYVSPYPEKEISYFSENAYLYLMALLFLLFVFPMSPISHNAESINLFHMPSFSFLGTCPLTFAAVADDDDDWLVDYECNGVGIIFFGSIYNRCNTWSSVWRWHSRDWFFNYHHGELRDIRKYGLL